MILHIKVVIEDYGGYFVATAPALPGLVIDGKTHEEIEQRMSDGIDVYLQSLEKHGKPLTASPGLIVEMENEMSPSEEIRWLTPNISEVNSGMLQPVS